MSQPEKDVIVLQLHNGRELVFKEKYLRRFKRYKDAKPLGVYNDEGIDEHYEIWLEKSKPADKDKIITQIHEMLHFVGEAANELDDPSDFDILAQFIYQICTQDIVERGEEK